MNKDSLRKLDAAIEAYKGDYPRAPRIVWRSLFPRSVVGPYQDDPIMRILLTATRDGRFSEHPPVEIIELVSRMTAPRPKDIQRLSGPSLPHIYFEVFNNSTASEFLELIAARLKHLETYRPTDGDFAIEELQNAYVGLAAYVGLEHATHTPTKGEVIAMAKERLEKRKKKAGFCKGSWSNFLKEAELSELPQGPAGRPSKAMLDENEKALRKLRSLHTQIINEFHGGDVQRALDWLEGAYGSQKQSLKSEEDRLRDIQSDSEGDWQ